MPVIRQVFIQAPDGLDSERFERRLYAARKVAERQVENMAPAGSAEARTLFREFYICSFSARTVVYKGMLMARQIRNFYTDLADESMASASSTPASARTHWVHGNWPTPTGSSRTTARSTRCAATATGWRRASGRCGRGCSGTT
jgi:glutamate synthase domain-containing protein 1